ncbi:MAG: hypothetical protein JW704_03525 [Anaerolineaceae bacterium]|nr:hypothetical protein [Anaerolineaceae bacterium]
MGKSDEITVYTAKEIDLDQMLSELGSGIKVTVTRKEPRWCDGYLDTIELDDEDRLSIEDLREMFGGRKLLIKVHAEDGKILARRTVKFPDPPRHEGRVLKPDDDESGKNDFQQSALFKLMFEQQQANSQMMLNFMKEQSDMFRKMAAERSAPAPVEYHSADNGIERSLELIDMIEEIRDRLKGDDDSNPMVTKMLSMAENYFGHMIQNQSKQPQSAPPPLPESRVLTDEALISQAAQRFHSMPVEQQQKAAQLFFGQIGQIGQVSAGENRNDVISSYSNEKLESSEIQSGHLRVELDEDDETELESRSKQS